MYKDKASLFNNGIGVEEADISQILIIDSAEKNELRIAFCSVNKQYTNELSMYFSSDDREYTEMPRPNEALLNDAYFSFYNETHGESKVGNIYLGVVINVVQSLNAAFVKFDEGKSGFLPFSSIHPSYYKDSPDNPGNFETSHSRFGDDKENTINDDLDTTRKYSRDDECDVELNEEGKGDNAENYEDLNDASDDTEKSGECEDEFGDDVDSDENHNKSSRAQIADFILPGQYVIVQVAKEQKGNKGATLTTYPSFTGRYILFLPNTSKNSGVSKKVDDSSEYARLSKVVDSIRSHADILRIAKDFSIIIRHSAKHSLIKDILDDFECLMRIWIGIQKRVRNMIDKKIRYQRLYKDSDILCRIINEISNNDVDQIIVSGEETYKKCITLLEPVSKYLAEKVHLYDEIRPLFSHLRIEHEIAKAYFPKIQLKSGGYIVINQTEALTVIDINSGKAAGDNIEETALLTNLDSVRVLLQQIKVRDIGGLIVIDFIDMREQANIDLVHRTLQKEIAKVDKNKISISEFSKFGIVQMTRRRNGHGLAEVTTRPCSECNGVGFIRAPNATINAIMRAVYNDVADLDRDKYNTIVLLCNQDIALRILNERRSSLDALSRAMNVCIRIDIDNAAGPDGFFIDCAYEPHCNENDELDSECILDDDQIEKNCAEPIEDGCATKYRDKERVSDVLDGEKDVNDIHRRKNRKDHAVHRRSSKDKKIAKYIFGFIDMFKR